MIFSYSIQELELFQSGEYFISSCIHPTSTVKGILMKHRFFLPIFILFVTTTMVSLAQPGAQFLPVNTAFRFGVGGGIAVEAGDLTSGNNGGYTPGGLGYVDALYMFNKNFGLGLALEFGQLKMENEGKDAKAGIFTAALNIEGRLPVGNGRFVPSAFARIGFLSSGSPESNYYTDALGQPVNMKGESASAGVFGFGLGAEYAVARNWSLTLRLAAYTTTSDKIDAIDNSGSAKDNYGTVTLGISYYLPTGRGF